MCQPWLTTMDWPVNALVGNEARNSATPPMSRSGSPIRPSGLAASEAAAFSGLPTSAFTSRSANASAAPLNTAEAALRASLAERYPSVTRWEIRPFIEGRQVVKIIIVPDKLVNIVVK